MFSITGLLIACLIYHTAYGVPDTQIVGGTDAPVGKYPYQVSLKLAPSGTHYCGGAILSKRYVITAAHCLISPVMQPTDLFIDVGTVYLSSNEMRFSADKLIIHPQFNDTKHQNDIGLIKLTKDINFTSNTNLIKLVDFDRDFEGIDFTVTGWGRLWNNDSIPNRLQQLTVTGFSQKECGNTYVNVNITKNHICTLRSVGQGICTGDTGSALTLNGALVGIASFGPKNCGSGNADVFTKVYHYKGWINTYVNAGINQQSNIILGLFMAYLCIHSFL